MGGSKGYSYLIKCQRRKRKERIFHLKTRAIDHSQNIQGSSRGCVEVESALGRRRVLGKRRRPSVSR
ncbi:hypothetical protein PM082_004656 [Marasmius tenuissimus]|nr:hypothetical protein PM082_004656 [Marasmius tenuissimus]